MNRFGELLLEARKHARLTQEVLAKKVDVHNTYISKMETGVESPPSRGVAVRLADALGISNGLVTLYVSVKDKAALERFTFFLEANVAGSEDVQEIRLVEVEEDEALGSVQQASAAALHTIAHPAIAIPGVQFGATGKEIERLIASARLSEEEEERVSVEVIEFTKRLLGLIEALRSNEKSRQ
jgi:transcriptional regulator with XRE-family HTH domain